MAKVELLGISEMETAEKIFLLDTMKAMVIKTLYKVNQIAISIDEIRNAVAKEEITESDINLIIDFFKNENYVTVADYYIGEERHLQFAIRS